VLVNHSLASLDLTGWTRRDRDGHVFRFPAFKLNAVARVTVHTGGGTDTARHLFWDSDGYVWNSGDVANFDEATAQGRIDARTAAWAR
jgi:hypothetical protein